MTWKEYVKHTISKANTSRAFLQRNIASCPRAVKDACYKIMIHTIIEYAAIIWSPYTQSLINNLEAVQRKAARFVCNNYYRYSSVSKMLEQLGWPTLEHQGLEARGTMTDKIINNLVHVDQRNLNILQPKKHTKSLTSSLSTTYKNWCILPFILPLIDYSMDQSHQMCNLYNYYWFI